MKTQSFPNLLNRRSSWPIIRTRFQLPVVVDAGYRVARVECPDCGLAIEATFRLAPGPPFSEHQHFAGNFLATRGNIREVEQVLGISYPPSANASTQLVEPSGPTPSPPPGNSNRRNENPQPGSKRATSPPRKGARLFARTVAVVVVGHPSWVTCRRRYVGRL